MKISIIIPMYHAEKTIKDCIESAIFQTYQDIEIVVVNDGSKDHSLSIVEEYQKKDSRIVVIDKENEGVSATRNKGIEVATGEYIAFLDADDQYSPDAMEKMAYYATQGADYVAGGVEIRHSYDSVKIFQTSETYRTGFYTTKEDIAKTLSYNRAFPICKLYRKDIIEKHHIRFDTQMSLGEDALFVHTYLLFIKNIAIVAEPLYYYIQQSSSLSTKYHSDIKEIYNKLCDAKQKLAEIYHFPCAPRSFVLAGAQINNLFAQNSPYQKARDVIAEIRKIVRNQELKKDLKHFYGSYREEKLQRFLLKWIPPIGIYLIYKIKKSKGAK